MATAPGRLSILKTYKLFIDGAFPRSESGRSLEVRGADGETIAHLCKASRKDLRDAVEAARRGHEKWAAASSYNRGQVLYRIAEMMEGKADELRAAIAAVGKTKSMKGSAARFDEVAAAIDRIVYYAGWADKYAQVLGCNNPVSGPFYNFTITEPSGVVACIAPDEFPLLGLVSVLAPVIVSGNASVVVASGTNPIPAAVFGEVLATSDVPAGVVNILTGDRAELLKFIAGHREIDAVHAAASSDDDVTTLRAGAAENVKRVIVRRQGKSKDAISWPDAAACQSPYWIEPFVEMKTVWHPAAV